MKKIILIISSLLIISAVVFAFNTSSSNIGGIVDSSDFITKFKNSPDSVLIDVRTPSEYESGHIEKAINVDYENSNFESEVKKLDPAKTYFVYCRSGNRSSKAIVIMNNNGIKNIYDLRGGISSAPELLK